MGRPSSPSSAGWGARHPSGGGISVRLVAYLSAGAVLLLAAVSLMRYQAGLLRIDRELHRLLQEITTRLEASLRGSLYEFDLETIRDTVAAEFPNPDLTAVIVRTERGGLLCGMMRSGEMLVATSTGPVGADYVSRTILVRVASPQGQQQTIGSVQIWLDRTKPRARLLQHLVRDTGQQLAVMALLVLLLAFITNRFVVLPLAHIRAAMQTTEQSAAQGRLGHLENRGPILPALAPAFPELRRMATALEAMIDTIRTGQQELQERESNLRVTLESIGDGVIATDAAGLVTRLNRAATRSLGQPAEAVVGRPLHEIFVVQDRHTRQPLQDPARAVFERGEMVESTHEAELATHSGRQRLVSYVAAPIRDADSRVLGVVLVFRDVTEAAALQEQLRQTQKLEAIGQLAGGVAHDFNNLLTGMLVNAQLIERLANQSDTAELAREIRKATRRAAALVDQLLAFSRKAPNQRAELDVHQLIGEVATLLRRSIDKRIKIKLRLEAALPTLLGDPMALENALLNLGLNARDAMPQGGCLSFITSDVEVRTGGSSADGLSEGRYIQIDVVDTGTGMSDHVRQHIFEPFFTTKGKGKGTGLGLSGAYGCIQAHNGVIRVASKLGCGSTFRLLLPVVAPSQVRRPALAPQPVVLGEGHILLVDDEALVRKAVASALEGLGYRVTACSDGVAGVNYFRECHHGIDLVILDLVMPRLSGEDAFAQMRAIDPAARILLSSGFSHPDVAKRLKDQGALGLLTKPFQLEELSRTIAQAIPANTHASVHDRAG
jgi:PAS domain S-box-containing protein